MRSRSAIVIGIVAVLGVISGVVLMSHQQTNSRCSMVGTSVACQSSSSYPYAVTGLVIVVAGIIVGLGLAVVRFRSRA
jgi:H+/Cl- antiporter ClcA